MAANKKQNWPVKNVALLTALNQSSSMAIRELLRKFDWRVAFSSDSLSEVTGSIEQGEASVLLVDDFDDLPCSIALRILLQNPITALTPTIALVSAKNILERNAIATLGCPIIIEKPLSTDKFNPAFNATLRIWSTGHFVTIRKIVEALQKNRVDIAFPVLMKLALVPPFNSIVAPALCHFLMADKNILGAEKLLLGCLKVSPQNLGLILTLAQLYLRSSAPNTASRLIISAKANFENCLALNIDKLQMEIMSDNLESAISTLKIFIDRNYDVANFQKFLGRIFFTEGREEEAKKFLGVRNFEKTVRLWSGESDDRKIRNAG